MGCDRRIDYVGITRSTINTRVRRQKQSYLLAATTVERRLAHSFRYTVLRPENESGRVSRKIRCHFAVAHFLESSVFKMCALVATIT